MNAPTFPPVAPASVPAISSHGHFKNLNSISPNPLIAIDIVPSPGWIAQNISKAITEFFIVANYAVEVFLLPDPAGSCETALHTI